MKISIQKLANRMGVKVATINRWKSLGMPYSISGNCYDEVKIYEWAEKNEHVARQPEKIAVPVQEALGRCERNLYVRLTPSPAEFILLPPWFADRVEVDTGAAGIPRGTWLIVNDHLVRRLQKKLSRTSHDEEQVERITAILDRIEKSQNVKEQD